jgi:tRNA-uridine 2-sulfurtransferase
MSKNKTKILVGLSGGVDSAVALYLLKKQGFAVEAAYMKCFSENVNIKGECPWKEDRLMAYRIAAQLDVPIQTLDFQKEYHTKVVDYIFDSYQKGLTPNPDILCNNEIKFKLFLDYAQKLGFAKIATGHYARITKDKDGFHLLRGKDANKDQSYFLAGLTQKQLSLAMFPIGELDKPEVRQIAKEAELANYDRKDSQGICFIGKVDLKTFLQQKIKPKTGVIEDTDGNRLGEHQGVWYYTIGQRKGLDLPGGPWYVAEKHIKDNKIIVGRGDDAKLYTNIVQVSELHWLGQEYKLPLTATAQIRYRQAPQDVTMAPPLDKEGVKNILPLDKERLGGVTATFKKPQKGVASGQILAIYIKDELVGSGNIL